MKATLAQHITGERLNKPTVENITGALEKKYGVRFVVTHIGDRWNRKKARAFVHPEKYPDIVFTAFSAIEGDVEDNFIAHLAGSRAEQQLVESLRNNGVTASASIALLGQPEQDDIDTHLTPKEYADRYQGGRLMISLAIDASTARAGRILDAIASAQKVMDCRLIISAFIFDPEQFRACSERMAEYPETGNTAMDRFSPSAVFGLTIDRTGCSLSEGELLEIMRRGR